MKLTHLPLRVATGAFILNSGMNKRKLPPEAAGGLHGMASTALPQVRGMSPEKFGQTLSASEIALGAALLVPLVPSALAGAGLSAFAGGLLALYLNTPGMREPGSVRPTQEGTALAKDIWLLGAGLTLLMDGLAERRER